MQEKQLCPMCLKNDRKSFLRSFQVNLEEALWLCEYKKCIYPLGQDCEPTFNRKLGDLPSERDVQTRVPSAQLALQIQVGNRLTECHQKIQKDVIGIQTGSPLFMKTLSKHRQLKQNGLWAARKGLISATTVENGANNSHTKSFTTAGTSLTQNTDNRIESTFSDRLKTESTLPVDSRNESKFPGLFLGKKEDFTFNSWMNGQSVEANIGLGKQTSENVVVNKLKKNCVGDSLGSLLNGHGEMKNLDITNSLPIGKLNIQLSTNSQCNTTKGKFLQWRNREALCWLDVVLCLLVHNQSLAQLVDQEEASLKDTVVYKLIKAHKQASMLMLKEQTKVKENCVNGRSGECSSGYSSQSVNTSALQQKVNGSTRSKNQTTKCSNSVTRSQSRPIVNGDVKLRKGDQYTGESSAILSDIRNEVLSRIQKKIHCEKGKPSSPVLAIPAILQGESPAVDGLFHSKYKFSYTCPHCKFIEDTDCDSVLPSLPAVVRDFSIGNPVHKKKCLNCSYTKGRRKMIYKSLSQSFMMHFLEGLPSNHWSSLEFTSGGVPYTVTGVVQYKRNPDHFVAWLRNPKDNTWIHCDDLKTPLCPVREESPRFPWKQIHIVMWERGEVNLHPTVNENEKILKSIPVIGLEEGCETDDVGDCVQGMNKTVNAGLLMNGSSKSITSKDSVRYPQNGNECISEENHNGKVTSGNSSPFVSSDKTTVLSAQNNLCSFISKPAFPKNSIYHDSRQQISIDSLRFLKSSMTASTTSSSVERSACSSISSTCSELSDNVSLPEFISTAQDGHNLLKPVPFRNDSPVQNSEFSDRNACEADPNSELTGGSDTKTFNTGHFKMYSRDRKLGDKLQVSITTSSGKTIPNIRPSSVFCRPPTSQSDTLGVQARVKTETQLYNKKESHINQPMIIKPVNVKPSEVHIKKEKKLKTINNDDIFASIKETVNAPVPVVKKAPEPLVKIEPQIMNDSSDNITDKHKPRFKRPGLFKPKSKSTKISRDAFRTLAAKTKTEVKCETPPIELINQSSGSVPYLTAVKQYLIDKTTDKSNFKVKFEGLNLKSAPNLARSVDLSGLKCNDSNSSSLGSSNGPSGESTPKKSEVSLPLVTDTLKRKGPVSKGSSPKRPKTEMKRAITNGSKTINLLKASATKLTVVKEKRNQVPTDSPTVTSVRTAGEPLKSGPTAVIPGQSGQQNGHVISCVQPLIQNNKENGTGYQSPEKGQVQSQEAESESVLQDLYDALNIPFTSIKETMPEIMADVEDIFGSIDMTSLDPCSPCKADNLHTALGNQGHLDCWFSSLMRRFIPQTPNLLERQQLWSPRLAHLPVL